MKVKDIGDTLHKAEFAVYDMQGKRLDWTARVPVDKGIPYYGVLTDRGRKLVYCRVKMNGTWSYQECFNADLKRK